MEGKHVGGMVMSCALVAFAAGWLGGSMSSTRPSPPVIASESLAAPQSSAPSSDLEHAVAELLAEMRGLRADLRGAIDNHSAREPVAAGKDAAPTDLVAALKELTVALREQPVRGERAGTGLGVRTAPSATGFTTLEALFEPGAKQADIARAHSFWTLQDLIDRYGRPDRLSPTENGVLVAYYTKPGDPNKYCEFALYSGQVIYIMRN